MNSTPASSKARRIWIPILSLGGTPRSIRATLDWLIRALSARSCWDQRSSVRASETCLGVMVIAVCSPRRLSKQRPNHNYSQTKSHAEETSGDHPLLALFIHQAIIVPGAFILSSALP
jgi:hypothetical protein